MKLSVDNNSEERNWRSSASLTLAQQQSAAPAAQFIDNRSATVARRNLVDTINNSPKQLAQRQQVKRLSGKALQPQPVQMMRTTPVNSDKGLEREADAMGGRANESVSGSSTVQRVIKVGEEVYDKKSETGTVVATLMAKLGKKKGEVAKYSGRIADLIDGKEIKPFTDYQALYDYLAPVLVPMESEYKGETTPPSNAGIDQNSIVLYRAMSDVEAGKLSSEQQFSMYVGKNNKESGIKFFATDINYSIGLSNKKNQEAYVKQDKELPYTHMLGAVLNKNEVAYGLEEDIGVHDDKGHTKDFLQSENQSAEKRNLTEHSEQGFKEVAQGEGHAVDSADRGYVFKHESGGLNFGVKAKTDENTKAHWKSPIEYFNSLVKWANFLGRFIMKKAG